MVKFGGHIEAVREGDLKELYLVPYNEIKGLGFEKVDDIGDDIIEKFSKAWNESLIAAENDFRVSRKKLWNDLFTTLAEKFPNKIRGLHPGNAIKMFVDNVPPTKAQELLARLTQIHAAATTNSEGLRKLVKKFDKNRDKQMSLELLPALYTSSLYAGQNMILDGIGLLRELLEGDDNSSSQQETNNFKPMIRHDSDAHHQQSVNVRYEELDWLKRLVVSLPPPLLPHLVAHRGFHHIKDRNDKRPLENSQSAYELAWSSGIHLCECDIAITKDEKLVLAHDENFMRLALDSTSHVAVRSIGDLTFRELISMPLKSGVRPPLLIDVLRSACAISDHSKLVIEIKPGNESAASALARLLLRHPDLRQAVAMIMSFDAVTMHRLRADLSVLELEASGHGTPGGGIGGRPRSSTFGSHHRVTSFDHFGVMGYGGKFGSHVSFDGSGSVGLDLSQTNLVNLDQHGHKDSEPALLPEGTANATTTNNHNRKSTIPKLMLLTVADPPKIPCELQVGVKDLSPVSHWLTTSDGALDGVYLQYEESMTTPEGAAALRQLSEKHLIGIWQYSGVDPDNYKTFEWLVQEGNVTFVNTDLPNHFKNEVLVRQQSTT